MPETQDLLLTSASVEISATAKTPTINVLAYSGGLMNVPGWGPVVIDLAGLDLSSPQVSLLADHDSSQGSSDETSGLRSDKKPYPAASNGANSVENTSVPVGDVSCAGALIRTFLT